eukprot:3125542-Prymnesium_polylepis.2
MRVKQSRVPAYFGPKAESIGGKTRFHQMLSMIGQPSSPRTTPRAVLPGRPEISPPSMISPRELNGDVRYSKPAYSNSIPACSMPRLSGERSIMNHSLVDGCASNVLSRCAFSSLTWTMSAVFSHRRIERSEPDSSPMSWPSAAMLLE